MTVEAEFAQLLIRMGTARGLDVETILAEMAQAPLPSFVDAQAVRSSLLEAVEQWWRADLEERLEQLRRQFQVGQAVAAPVAQRSTPSPTPPAAASSRAERSATPASVQAEPPTPEPMTQVADATLHGEPENAAEDPAEALPPDATMIWNTNHG